MTRARTTEGTNTHYSSTERWENMREESHKYAEHYMDSLRKDEFIAPMVSKNL